MRELISLLSVKFDVCLTSRNLKILLYLPALAKFTILRLIHDYVINKNIYVISLTHTYTAGG